MRATAGGHRRRHAGGARGRDDVEEAGVQVGLAADERELARAEGGELAHDLERLGGRQLVSRASARASRSGRSADRT